ncbi:hypothetical protein L484_012894 [Morus notabilis]|uniref:Uncharacterized protein n=1 Tax=Morus notabilis TaxID=981085 RepID=W9RFH4_9ROSA|nr:hypothetical protein L484_012894 [Morus notabilis]
MAFTVNFKCFGDRIGEQRSKLIKKVSVAALEAEAAAPELKTRDCIREDSATTKATEFPL